MRSDERATKFYHFEIDQLLDVQPVSLTIR
jgi:hypothetical protein